MDKDLSDKLTDEFKKNLKAILEERKGTTNPKKLSIAAGLGETAVRDILQNRSASPKLDTINKLAKALKVPVYRLIPSMIDQSYDELENLRAENSALKEELDSTYTTMEDSLKALKDRSKNLSSRNKNK